MKRLSLVLALLLMSLSKVVSAEFPATPVFLANDVLTATIDRSSLKIDPDGVTLSYAVTFKRARINEDKIRIKYQTAYAKILCASMII